MLPNWGWLSGPHHRIFVKLSSRESYVYITQKSTYSRSIYHRLPVDKNNWNRKRFMPFSEYFTSNSVFEIDSCIRTCNFCSVFHFILKCINDKLLQKIRNIQYGSTIDKTVCVASYEKYYILNNILNNNERI